MKLTFHGAAEDVTGSNFLLESGGYKILVDCGLHQGSHFAERQNFEDFAYDPKEIQAVVVTHAHLDHTGRLPKLFSDGFRGKVYSTPPTKDFAELILLDSQGILCREAEREGRPEFCSLQNVGELMKLWKPIKYHEVIQEGPFTIELFDAGHILGSSIVKIEAEGKSVVFSGDLGNNPTLIIKPTERLMDADYCLIESTYGDRVHENIDKRREMLEDAIEDTVKNGGTLMIPAFAMERTQELLYHLEQLFQGGRIPSHVPVYIDSPLAIKLTAAYKKYKSYFNEETTKMIDAGDDILNFPELHFTLTSEESRGINHVPPPKIIIAGSGMSHGGRILHHEMRYLPDPKSMLLFVGYQAKGSMGRELFDGARMVRIFHEEVPVRCHVKAIGGYSAHADQPQLLSWLEPMRKSLKKVFVIHGEKEASEVLAAKIRDTMALSAVVPMIKETVEL